MVSTTAFGPQGPNYTTNRPPFDPQASSGIDTWFKNCSAPGAKDGTSMTADFFNVLIGNLRYACRTALGDLDPTDDTMLYRAIQQMLGNGSTILKDDVTLYVNPAIGDDANDGTSNVAGKALKTIQMAITKAYSFIAGSHKATIRLASGLYNAGFTTPTVAGPNVEVIGDETTPANVQIVSTILLGAVLSVQGPNVMWIKGVKVSDAAGGNAANLIRANTGAIVSLANIEFGGSGGGSIDAGSGTVYIDGSIRFAGNQGSLFSAGYGGLIQARTGAAFTVVVNITVTVTATVAYGATMLIPGTPWTLLGTVTGARYSATINGILNTNGSGSSYFPGSTAGTTATGGQYL